MFFRYLLYAFLLYLLYRFVFHLIIPVYKTTRQVRKEFQNMQSRMQDHINQQQAPQQPSTSKTGSNKEASGDYIDFEEVK